jgi:small GTP-binding protein
MAESIRAVIVGDGATGKTTLIESLSGKSSLRDSGGGCLSTFSEYNVEIEGIDVTLYDSASQDDYDSVRPQQQFKQADVFVCLFSSISPPSFNNVKTKWQLRIEAVALRSSASGRRAPVVLVGTKIDLREHVDMIRRLADRGMEPVSDKQAQQLAKDIGAAQFIAVDLRVEQHVEAIANAIVSAGTAQFHYDRSSTKKKKTTKQCVVL